MGRIRRVVLRFAGVALLVLLALLAAAHLAPVRRAVATWAEGRAGRALHARVQIGDLSYNVFLLRVTARDVRISPEPSNTAPWFEAETVVADAPWSMLRGRLHFQSIEVDRPRVRLEELRQWLTARPPSSGKPVQRFDVDRVAVRDLALSGYPESAPFSIDIEQFSADGTTQPGGFTAPIHARGGSLRAGPYSTALRSLDGTLGYDGQRISLTPLRAQLGQHELEATGDIVLLGAHPGWTLAVQLAGDVGPVLASWPEVPVTSGHARITGNVSGPLGSPVVTLDASSDRLVFAGIETRGLRASTRISGEGVAIETVAFSALGGQVEGTVDVGNEGRPDRARVTWRGVDLAALLRAVDSPVRATARADGSATLGGRFGDIRSWRLDAATRLSGPDAPAAIHGQPRLVLEHGRWKLSMASGRLGSTEVGLDLRGQFPAAGDRVVPRSSLQGAAALKTASVPDALAWAAGAGLDVSPEVRGIVSGPLALDLSLSGTVGSPVLDTRFDRQTVTVRDLGPVLVDGPLRLSAGPRLASDGLTLAVAGGRASLSGAASLAGPLALDVDARDLDVASLAAALGWQEWMPRRGRVSASGRLGGTRRAPESSLRVQASDVEWFGQHIDEISGPVITRGTRIASDRLEIREGDGRASVAGAADWSAGTFDATATATRFPLRPLSGPGVTPLHLAGTLDLSLDARGPFTAPTGAGRVSATGLSVAEIDAGDVVADLSMTGDGFASLDARIPSLQARATARTALARPWAFEADASVDGADVAHALEIADVRLGEDAGVSGTLSATAHASGRLDRVADADLTLSIREFDGRAYALPLRLSAPAELRVTASEISTAGIELATGSTRARLQGRLTREAPGGDLVLRAEGALADVAPLIERVAGTQATANGQFSASVSASGTRQAPVLGGAFSLREGTVEFVDRPAISELALAATLRAGRLEVESVRARVGAGTLDATGSLPLHLLARWMPAAVASANPSSGPARLQATLDDNAGGTLMALAGLKPPGDIDGTFDLGVDLTADRLALDGIAGTLRVEQAAISVLDVAASQVDPAIIQIHDGVATFEEWRWQGARTDLALRGSVGFAATPLDYDVEVRGPVDLSLLGAIVPGRTAGHVRTDLRLRQVDGRAMLNGDLVVSKGAWVDRGLQIALSDVNGTVRLLTDRIVVDGLTGRLNGGEVTASGSMLLGEDGNSVTGSIGLTGRRVTVEYPPRVVNDFDADLRLVSPGPEGTLFGIVGKAAVRPGPVRKSVRQLALMFTSSPPVLPTPAVERRRALMAQVGLDIQMDTVQDIVADSNEVRAQMGGTVRLMGTLASPGMLGRIDIRDDGELFLVGRVYKLRGGQIDFVDGTSIDPRLNIRGETTVSEYQIEMQVTGPVDRLDFRLRSVPPLGQGDLSSLLVTGQTLKERREAANESASEAARAQVISAVSSEYLGAIGRWFGVDTVRIENSARDLSAIDIDPVSRLTVTKRIGPYFEVIYSQSIETNDDIYWVIVYDPGWRKLEVSTKFTTQAGETVELRQELLLGAGSRPSKVNARARRNATAPRVAAVNITGVPDEDVKRLKSKLSVTEGKRFDAFKWIRDQGRVDDYFVDQSRLRTTVAASNRPAEDGSGTVLTYAIERGGLTQLRVEGYDFGRDELESMRAAWADSPIDEFVPDALSEAARLALAQAGYLHPEVKVDLATTGSGDAEAVVRVSPGQRTGTRDYAFAGNATFSSERLKELLTSSDLGVQPWVSPRTVVGPLEAYYGAAGFLNVQITPGTPREEGSVSVLPIEITEGQQFRVAAVNVTGNRQVSEDAVRSALGLGVGTVYTGAATNDAVRRLTDYYGRQGHSAAKVKADTRFDREASTATLAISIEEGIRQIVDSVTTDGKDIITRQRLLDRSIKVEPGKPVDSTAVETSQRRLYDLGTFSAVEPRFEPVGTPVQDESGGLTQPVKVVFGLEEYPRYRLRYGFQVSTTTLTTQGYTSGAAKPGATVDLRRSNILGTGVDAGLGSFVTSDRYRLRGLLTSATLGGRQIQNTLSVTKDYQSVVQPDVDFTARVLTISAEQRWRPRKKVELAYGYNLEYQDVELNYPSRSGDSFSFLLSARLASLFNYVSYDTRDNILNATRGMFHSANVEVGSSWMGSELDYASYLGQHFLFVPFGRVRLASAVRFGSVGILDAQENSLEASFVRFRTGGGTTVRGYRQDDLTPDFAVGIPRGGDVLLVLNQEVRFTTWKWIELAAFVDAGNAFATFQDFSLSGLKLGVGTGLRLATPFGVVRLDVGFPKPRPDNYPLALWYFSFGQAF